MTFKILEDPELPIIDYYGYKIRYDNSTYNWIATDKNGNICFYTEKPYLYGDEWKEDKTRIGCSAYITRQKYEGDWKESLLNIKEPL